MKIIVEMTTEEFNDYQRYLESKQETSQMIETINMMKRENQELIEQNMFLRKNLDNYTGSDFTFNF